MRLKVEICVYLRSRMKNIDKMDDLEQFLM